MTAIKPELLLTDDDYDRLCGIAKVRCDKCGWVSPPIRFTETPSWRTKACPECKAYPVVSSLETYEFAKLCVQDLILFGKVREETKAKKPSRTTALGREYGIEGEIEELAPEFFPSDKPKVTH